MFYGLLIFRGTKNGSELFVNDEFFYNKQALIERSWLLSGILLGWAFCGDEMTNLMMKDNTSGLPNNNSREYFGCSAFDLASID